MIIDLQKFILILVRITAFFVSCPGFSFKGIPNTFKIALSVSVAMMIYLVTPEIEVIDQILYFAILVIKEALFGLAIGYVTKLLFATMEIAGQFVDFQVGFSMASVFDPSMGTNASNYGRLYYWLSISIFFILNIHQRLIITLIESFTYIPITTVQFNGIGIESVIILFGRVFELAFNVAAPMIIVVLVTDIVLGIISRTVPQINVLMLGMPLKAMVGFFATMIILSWLINSFGTILEMTPGYMERIMSLFS
ncbi:flagellar biosynthetic protein FliR [Alkalibaculum sp. M08DMB]|uniref:Flagellar biosynthetic protein FliR n=1 Tax=Alkalibaculum sporogenes TaxID=2655001 RepID=A0A6A7K6H1_9FIRM|nr:flagellar biosynthetic protein FliR [Alkalibaculum sporogenes]MPW24807.1 flagellar biosynthetic protein FliR [Alkalibaculum sporogenes]